MFQQLIRFARCSRGNVAFMTAGALVPLLTLTAGGLEFAERQRVEVSMQHAADTAVMAAFDTERRNWRNKVRRANRFFDANFHHAKRVKRVKKRLRGQEGRKRMVLTFQASSQVQSLFGEFNPFTSNTIRVTSRAELVYRSRRGPRLISPAPTGGKSD
ncbi:MAG: pilus assembly protein TadG-related protein [Rhizobiaceae bacterium]